MRFLKIFLVFLLGTFGLLANAQIKDPVKLKYDIKELGNKKTKQILNRFASFLLVQFAIDQYQPTIYLLKSAWIVVHISDDSSRKIGLMLRFVSHLLIKT